MDYRITTPSQVFTRPADTTAYTSGDLVANSTSAATPMVFAAAVKSDKGTAFIRRVRLLTSSVSVTNAQFRVHFYTSAPTIANNDNAAWSTSQSGYIGSVDVTVDKAFTDGAEGIGVPNAGLEINFVLTSGRTVWVLIEARAAYTPTNAGTFTVIPEIWQLNDPQ